MKLSFDFIKQSFENEGYILLDTKYENSSKKLKYICPNGHEHSISWSNWHHCGARCPYCANRPPINIEFVRSEFNKEGYILLSDKYYNCDSKLEYICSSGHRHYTTWDKWHSGVRCYYCSNIVKKSIESVKYYFEKDGYELLTKQYINNKQKLKYKCVNGHYGQITWRDWSSGRRCPQCAIINNSGGGHWNWKGGISCEPYCDAWADKEYKESIKERDNYRCQNPDCWRTSNKLCIHHIDYNKKNCSPKNLITLCNSCNVRANFNRFRHKEFYQNIMMSKKY